MEASTIHNDHRLIIVTTLRRNFEDNSREILTDGSLHFFTHLSTDGQFVNLQVIEPLRQYHFVSKFQSQLFDMWQIRKEVGHSSHTQLNTIRELLIIFCHEFFQDDIIVFHLSYHPPHLGRKGMRFFIHLGSNKASNKL